MDEHTTEVPLQCVAFVGGFLPRQEKATANTTRLCYAFLQEVENCDCLILALSDFPGKYRYSSQVRFELAQNDLATYRSAADFLNLRDVDLVNLQFDPSVFGGPSGSYILTLVSVLRAPVVTTLYALEESSDPVTHQVIRQLGNLSSRVIVLDDQQAKRLASTYGVPASKIDIIPIPQTMPDAGHEACWRDAIQQYQASFHQARTEPALRFHHREIPATGSAYHETLPVLKLDHFLRMTDETGMLRRSILSLPDYKQGYSTEDNARALMFSLLLEQVGEGPFIHVERQVSRYLAFLWNAFDEAQGLFRGQMNYARVWQEGAFSEEAHGVSLWALGMLLGRADYPGMVGVASRLFERALPAVRRFSSPRAWAYTLLGISEYLYRFAGDRNVDHTGRLLANRLISHYHTYSIHNWEWFQAELPADSACIPQALLAYGLWSGTSDAIETGLRTLEWLASFQYPDEGYYVPVGDQGYFARDQQRARFAQRPIEFLRDDLCLPGRLSGFTQPPLGGARQSRLRLVLGSE